MSCTRTLPVAFIGVSSPASKNWPMSIPSVSYLLCQSTAPPSRGPAKSFTQKSGRKPSLCEEKLPDFRKSRPGICRLPEHLQETRGPPLAGEPIDDRRATCRPQPAAQAGVLHEPADRLDPFVLAGRQESVLPVGDDVGVHSHRRHHR